DAQHVAEPQPNSRRGAVAAGPATGEDFAVLAGLRCASKVFTGATRGRSVAVLDFAQDVSDEHIGGEDLQFAPLGLVDERVRGIEAHRLLVEQTAQELWAVVLSEPGGLISEQPESRRVRLG